MSTNVREEFAEGLLLILPIFTRLRAVHSGAGERLLFKLPREKILKDFATYPRLFQVPLGMLRDTLPFRSFLPFFSPSFFLPFFFNFFLF